MAIVITDRNGDVQRLLGYFHDDPQRSARFQDVVRQCQAHALAMCEALEDSPELADGLEHLVLAKDCFLRAAR